MITKTAKLNNEMFDGYFAFIDQLREDGLITRARQSIFKDKLRHLFSIRNGLTPDVKFCDHFPNEYGVAQISFHPTHYIFNNFSIGERPKPIPNLHLTFVGHEDGDEHKLLVSISGNYISELPIRYFINDTCVSVINVKDIRTMRILIKRLVGQKLYND